MITIPDSARCKTSFMDATPQVFMTPVYTESANLCALRDWSVPNHSTIGLSFHVIAVLTKVNAYRL